MGSKFGSRTTGVAGAIRLSLRDEVFGGKNSNKINGKERLYSPLYRDPLYALCPQEMLARNDIRGDALVRQNDAGYTLRSMTAPLRLDFAILTALRAGRLGAADAARLAEALRIKPGEHSWATRAGLAESHYLIRQYAQRFYPGLRRNACAECIKARPRSLKARQINTILSRPVE